MKGLFSNLQSKMLYIFGAGKRGKVISDMLENLNIEISGFIDNNCEKQGRILYNNKRCYGLEEIINLGENCNIIVSPLHNSEIIEQLKKQKIFDIYDGEEILKKYHYIPFIQEKNDYQYAVPFNHYESPYADIREIHAKEKEYFDYSKRVLDIEFNIEHQIELLETMKGIDIIPWDKTENFYRYNYNNNWFCRGSADVLYYMIRILNPKRIIEVGSGFSTAVMLDTNFECYSNGIEIISIEPNAERLKALLKKNDNLTIYEKKLQDMPVEIFQSLGENDILFIDSSHVAKVDGDVNYYLFEILPRLKKGVYIHIHDMFYPFIYPSKWVFEGRAYNEMYLLRAFLMNNSQYSVQFFGDMIMQLYPEKLSDKITDIGGSLWIRKE